MGTPSYMAPEQASGQSNRVGPGADVFALGAILYELLTGRPPFRGETEWDTIQQVLKHEPVSPRKLQPTLPRDLETIYLSCLHKDPSRRYAAAQVLADDLRWFLDNEPIHARPIGRLERGWRWMRRHPVATIGAVTALLLVIATGIGFEIWRLTRLSHFWGVVSALRK